jgi:Flp pilus assembly protein CpaB
VERRIAVLVVAMLCAVPLIMLAAGVIRAQSAAEDAGNTGGSETTYIVLYKQEAVPAASAGQS